MDGDCLYYEIRMIPAFVDGLTWHTNWESIDEIAQEGVGAALGGVYGLYYDQEISFLFPMLLPSLM